ncbi:hypothetical protein CBL_02786 [Carabus blaptoides fortunei]
MANTPLFRPVATTITRGDCDLVVQFQLKKELNFKYTNQLKVLHICHHTTYKRVNLDGPGVQQPTSAVAAWGVAVHKSTAGDGENYTGIAYYADLKYLQRYTHIAAHS